MKYFFQTIVVIFTFALATLTSSAFAWNNFGHRVIAQIALDQLTPQTRDALTPLLVKSRYHDNFNNEFSLAATWPDYIRGQDIHTFDRWHFINLPMLIDSTPPPPMNQENVAWAIQQSRAVLKSNRSTPAEKKLFLKFFIHFEGDIHQPLHCATRVSKTTPLGDSGGNLYPIALNGYRDLHDLWDDAGGLFGTYFPHQGKLSNRKIQIIASDLEAKYPLKFFGNKIAISDPYAIAKESHGIAQNFVYQTPLGQKPSAVYLENAQKIAGQQLALAGYRLAYQLNHLSQEGM